MNMGILLLLFCVLFFATRPTFAHSTTIIGHRGASGYEPENTLRSFQRALDMQVDMIELDVFVCKSGQVVVIHDATINRTTNGRGSIKNLTWRQLRHYKTAKGEHIPLLSEVLDLVDQRAIVNIEIKDPQASKPVAQLIHEYITRDHWNPDNFIVSSFHQDVIQEFHSMYPAIKTGLIVENKKIDPIDTANELHAHYVVLHYPLINKELIGRAHACRKKIFAYTVNSPTVAKKLQKLNIDGIITNYPDILP